MVAEDRRISRSDLEDKFRALQSDLQGKASDKRQSLVAVASVAATVVVVVAYLFGRRSGRRRGSRVEFRRF